MHDEPHILRPGDLPLPTRELYEELGRAYDHFNRTLFENKLPRCLITLQREKRACGYFSAKRFGNHEGVITDEIALNPSYFAVTPLVETLQTLVHEQVHCLQHHYGTPGRVRYHNEEFADLMEQVGLMASSTGRPGGKRTGDRMADYAIKGGRFLLACEELITERFKLWYDLAPHMDRSRLGPGPMSQQLTAQVGGGAPPVSANPLVALAVQHLADHTRAHPRKPSNKSLRSKYTCHGCNSNVWGKPGLQVGCVRCKRRFDEVTSTQQDDPADQEP